MARRRDASTARPQFISRREELVSPGVRVMGISQYWSLVSGPQTSSTESAMTDSEQEDAHSAMLRLTTQLEEKEAAGQQLSEDEQVVADIVWIDVQVAPNGFDGWPYCTSNERIRQTLDALAMVGLRARCDAREGRHGHWGGDPAKMSDAQREAQLDTLSETDRRRLGELDNEFYDAVKECMECCLAFLKARGINDRR